MIQCSLILAVHPAHARCSTCFLRFAAVLPLQHVVQLGGIEQFDRPCSKNGNASWPWQVLICDNGDKRRCLAGQGLPSCVCVGLMSSCRNKSLWFHTLLTPIADLRFSALVRFRLLEHKTETEQTGSSPPFFVIDFNSLSDLKLYFLNLNSVCW